MTNLEWITLVLGTTARLAIPIVITVLVVWHLRRLDARWQEEAFRQAVSVRGQTIPIAQINCWDVHDCSPEQKATCQAYLNPNIPCWEAHRRNGHLQDACQGCAFRKMKLAATPVVS